MSDIIAFLDKMRHLPDCKVYPSAGLPVIRHGHVLPEDVRVFYSACGGLTWSLMVGPRLWDSFSVLPPDRVVLANPVVTGTPENELRQMGGHDDISWDWYTIAENGNGDYFSIDLSPDRLGRCYDSFHETHALVGQTPILGRSFTEFVRRVVDHIESTRQDNWRDWEPGLQSLSFGDAYD